MLHVGQCLARMALGRTLRPDRKATSSCSCSLSLSMSPGASFWWSVFFFFFGPVVRRTFFWVQMTLSLLTRRSTRRHSILSIVCDGCAADFTDGLFMGKCFKFEDETEPFFAAAFMTSLNLINIGFLKLNDFLNSERVIQSCFSVAKMTLEPECEKYNHTSLHHHLRRAINCWSRGSCRRSEFHIAQHSTISVSFAFAFAFRTPT